MEIHYFYLSLLLTKPRIPCFFRVPEELLVPLENWKIHLPKLSLWAWESIWTLLCSVVSRKGVKGKEKMVTRGYSTSYGIIWFYHEADHIPSSIMPPAIPQPIRMMGCPFVFGWAWQKDTAFTISSICSSRRTFLRSPVGGCTWDMRNRIYGAFELNSTLATVPSEASKPR